jgi:LysM repeat protein
MTVTYYNHQMRNILLIFAFLMTSCASQIAPGNSNDSLDPYRTSTPSLTPAPNVIVVIETPVPTSTPFMYTIQEGDTFSALAGRFKIPQDELRAANPGIHPNSMPVGGTLLIPDPSSSFAAATTPTPVLVPVSQIICHASMDSGVWCFALIQNNTPGILENVSAQITLLDENNNILSSQTAFTPLNIIPPNSSLPVYIFFPNTPANVSPQAQLLSAVQLSKSNERYLPAKIQNAITQIDWDGRTAQVSGQIYLPPESKAAARVWIAAVAYDKSGRVVGLKRWAGGAIQPGGILQFNFTISSLASVIHKVEFIVEARP